MNSLSDFLKTSFESSRDTWEKALKAELKTEDISSKLTKKTHEGPWPVLSHQADQVHLLPSTSAWKKSSQTYALIDDTLKQRLSEDLSHGVRLFFFHSEMLNESQWKEINQLLSSEKDAEIVLLGQKSFSSSLPLVQESQWVSGKRSHDQGGNNIQELAELTYALTKNKSAGTVYLAVYLDSQFFKNIAKVRAARLLARKVLAEQKVKAEIKILALTSYREWTLYERYSNMLRNAASVASAYIAGAEFVQSSGYQMLFDLEYPELKAAEHDERSKRMARNTAHILALESMLGVVQDPSSGSFHLENLTEHYARSAWEMMQQMYSKGEEWLKQEVSTVRQAREKSVRTRKHILAGMNDFPDPEDKLNVTSKARPGIYRIARDFEDLRMQVENMPVKPKVHIALYGDYALLNARINFIKNFFELLGLKVTDPGHSVTELDQFRKDVAGNKDDILVVCSTDDQYAQLTGLSSAATFKYVAGKAELAGFQNIHAGQDTFAVLQQLVSKWGSR